jgi:hypothetical protein
MATTINAATTGLVETSDGTAVLDLQTGGTTAIRVNATQAIGVGSTPSFGTTGQFLTSQGSAASPTWTTGGTGTVTSVGWTGGIVTVATATTTPAFTIAGTSGGIVYFNSASTWASSAALTLYGAVYGGGAGGAPVSTAAGTTGQFLGANTGAAPTWQTPAGGGSAATPTTLGTVYGYAAGTPNASVGYQSLNVVSGSNNAAVGQTAGVGCTTGASNCYLGGTAGNYSNIHATGSGCTYVGAFASSSSTSVSSELAIVSGAAATSTLGKGASTAFISGNGGSTYNGANTTTFATTSDRRLKKNIADNNVGLDAIKSIQVRNFEYRLPEEVDAELKPTDAIVKSGVQLGVIAQELQAVLPDCVKQESTGVLSVDADNLSWYMVNAIKQLSAALDSANARIAALEAK